MGKKVSQASVKISKNIERQQFNSLIKVLRPKVYITDSSSFKKLVQELTGNGTSTTFSPPHLEPNVVENCSFIGAEVQREPESSINVSVSTEATINYSSDELCYATMMNEEFNQVFNQTCFEDSIFQDSVANQPLDHLLGYQNIESLLFDVVPNPFYNFYEQIEQQEVSIYDYELLGML